MSEFKEVPQIITMEQLEAKYNFRFTEKGNLESLEKAPRNEETPVFNMEAPKESLLEPYQEVLQRMMLKGDSGPDVEKDLLSIANTIIKHVTNQNISDSAIAKLIPKEEFTFLKHAFNDFFKSASAEIKEGARSVGEYHGSHFEGGLIIVEGGHGNRMFPLVFHEVGHSFYQREEAFEDELRAYYFQLLCTEIFESEFQKIGMTVKYPELTDDQLPSQAHKDAYLAARWLHLWNQPRMYEMLVTGNEKKEKEYDMWQAVIKQPSVK